MVFLAWLNGFQDHFVMLNGAQAADLSSGRFSEWQMVLAFCHNLTLRRAHDLAYKTLWHLGLISERGIAYARFSTDHSALSLNTATLSHNLDGHGAGWSPEQVIDGCAERGFGGITFWRRELGDRAYQIGQRVKAAGLIVTGLCRTPYITGREAGTEDEIKGSIDMAAL